MYVKFSTCPNKKCPCGKGVHNGWYIKKGYYKTKWNAQPVPRYRCRSCGLFFSTHTFRPTYRQKKPYLNQEIGRWYSSGTTQRRMAIVMRINRKTVVRKFLLLADAARRHHAAHLKKGGIQSSHIQIDEMMTFEHTRLKPLSITLAVRAKTGEIIDAQVAQMHYNGQTALIAERKYGSRPDFRPIAREDVLRSVRQCTKPNAVIVSDGDPHIAKSVQRWVPKAEFKVGLSRIARAKKFSQNTNRRNENDGLFTLNYTAAKIRHDMSRMARKVWVTTKAMWALQAHLYLYIAWTNGYQLDA